MTMTTSVHIEALFRVTSQLINVMNHEVELLRAMRVSEINDIQAKKHDLTLIYEEAVAAVAAEPAILEAMEPALRAELAELAAQFDSALDRNTRALDAVKASHNRLLQTIADAVSEKRASQRAYTPDGSLDTRRTGRNSPALSLTLDQRL